MKQIAINPGVSAELRRSSRRRSIGIKVYRGQVVVSAPTRAPLGEIQQFVAQKARWIEKHLRLQQQALAEREQNRLDASGHLPFLGDRLQLVNRVGQVGVQRCGNDLEVGGDVTQRKPLLAQWLAQQALDYLAGRTALFAPLVGVQPKGLRVRYYKSRWGSCNRRGELQFNWLLMMAPPAVVDYVVVHELAHIQHFDHSPAFWQLVARVMPDYARHRAWLRQQTILVW